MHIKCLNRSCTGAAGGGCDVSLIERLADLRAHNNHPVNRLLQEAHAVVGRYVAKHFDLLREALFRGKGEGERKQP